MEGIIMAKIISGGITGTSGIVPSYNPSQDASTEESGLSYFGRNFIAKAPTYAYEAARTGFGLGNILQPLAHAIIPQPEWNQEGLSKLPYGKNAEPVDITRLLPFVSQSTARQEAASVLPKVMTEQRQGDWWPEFLGGQAIPLAMNAPKSLADAMQTLGMYGGGYLGGKLAGSYAPSVTENKDIQDVITQLGGIGGAKAGAIGAKFIPGKQSMIPTKALAPEKLIETLREQQQPQYDTAIALEGDKLGDSTQLVKKLNGISRNLGLGMEESDKNAMARTLGDIESASINGLSLEQAKTALHNVNARLYDHNTNDTLKPHLSKLNKALNEFILENGSAEHNKVWQKAQKTSQDIFGLETKIAESAKNKESLAGIFKESLKKYKLPIGFGTLAEMFGFGHKAAGIIGGLSNGARRIFMEGKYLHEVAHEHPDIFNKYIDTLLKVPKMDPAKAALRINNVAQSLEEYYPEEEETSSSKSKVISGGLI